MGKLHTANHRGLGFNQYLLPWYRQSLAGAIHITNLHRLSAGIDYELIRQPDRLIWQDSPGRVPISPVAAKHSDDWWLLSGTTVKITYYRVGAIDMYTASFGWGDISEMSPQVVGHEIIGGVLRVETK